MSNFTAFMLGTLHGATWIFAGYGLAALAHYLFV